MFLKLPCHCPVACLYSLGPGPSFYLLVILLLSIELVNLLTGSELFLELCNDSLSHVGGGSSLSHCHATSSICTPVECTLNDLYPSLWDTTWLHYFEDCSRRRKLMCVVFIFISLSNYVHWVIALILKSLDFPFIESCKSSIRIFLVKLCFQLLSC